MHPIPVALHQRVVWLGSRILYPRWTAGAVFRALGSFTENED